MDLSLIANIKDIPAVSNFLSVQEDNEWLNKNSPLFEAQKIHNKLMNNNKERIPMVIEYLQDKTTRVSVEMWINPSRLNLSNQKIVSKAVTRSAIFYHHWGNDNPQLQMSGTTGDSGMVGIKKLETIYNMSGVLLNYDENNAGPRYVDGTTSFLDSIASGNIAGAVGALMNGGVKNLSEGFMDQAKAGLVSAITGKGNSKMRSSAVYNAVNKTMGASIQKINDSIGATTKVGSTSKNSFIGSVGGALLTKMVSNRIGLTASDNDTQVVDFNTASKGWADINDELQDPWRPRMIWIYFEDRVYIGFFDSFSYQRVAETPLINYDMRFTVIRTVDVTSYNPKMPEFKPAQAITLPTVYTATAAAKAYSGAIQKTTSAKLVDFAANTPAAIEAAKLEILKTKETLKLETLIAIDNNSTITSQRTQKLEDWAKQVRKTIGIKDDDELYGVREITDDQRIQYYGLGSMSAVKGQNTDAAKAADSELARIRALVSKLKTGGKLTDTKRLEYWDWVQKIHVALGTTDRYESWENDLNPV